MNYKRLMVILLDISLVLFIVSASLDMLATIIPILSDIATYLIVVTPIPAMFAMLIFLIKLIHYIFNSEE